MIIDKIKCKLDEILDKEVVIDKKVLTEDEIKCIEKKFDIKLPSEYIEFLKCYNEVYLKENYRFPMCEKSKITPKDGFESMDYFYAGNTEEFTQDFMDDYREKMIPIGEASGDFICLGVKGEMVGKVYYMYHEEETNNKNYFLIANSFNEFILSFKEYKTESNINLDEIEIELDDDLWND